MGNNIIKNLLKCLYISLILFFGQFLFQGILQTIYIYIVGLWIFSFLYIKVDDILSDIIGYIKYNLLKQQDSFNVLERKKENIIKRIYLKFYRFVFKISELPEDIYYETKYFIQRGLRGYADRDVWSIDWYLTDVILKMVKQLKKTMHGYIEVVEDKKYYKNGNLTDEGDRKSIELSNKIFDSILLTFEIAKKIETESWIYQESKTYDEKLAKEFRKINKQFKQKYPHLYTENSNYVMTKEDCKVYEKGWKLFQKYFFKLWD